MIFSDERVFMNTIIRLQVVSSKGTVFTRSIIEEAFACFDHVVKTFSRFSRTSELSQLNHSQGKATIVSQEMFDLVKLSLEVAKLTDNSYDPTIIDLLEAYGYDSKQDYHRLNRPEIGIEVQKLALNRSSCQSIVLEDAKLQITLMPNQKVDLGSVAKGYAIDLAYKALSGKGFDGFLINAGGDLRANGCNSKGLPWKVMLYRSQLPNQRFQQQVSLGTMSLENMAIAGSGGWARRVGSFHHLLNSKDGQPINHVTQTYILGKDATHSDIWATALYTMGPAGLELITKQGMAGLIVLSNGDILKTEDFEYDI